MLVVLRREMCERVQNEDFRASDLDAHLQRLESEMQVCEAIGFDAKHADKERICHGLCNTRARVGGKSQIKIKTNVGMECF